MQNRLYRAANKALAVTLTLAIIATGGLAVSLTHVSASVTVTFGRQPAPFSEAVTVADLKQFAPLPIPQHKPVR